MLIYHKESGVSKQVIFIPRLVYGDDLLDVNTCPFAGGCRISAVPFYNEKLRADIESKWRVKSASATDGDVLPHIWDENRILDSSLDDITIKSCKKHGKKYLEVRCPAVSTRECSFYEVTNSEVCSCIHSLLLSKTNFEIFLDEFSLNKSNGCTTSQSRKFPCV